MSDIQLHSDDKTNNNEPKIENGVSNTNLTGMASQSASTSSLLSNASTSSRASGIRKPSGLKPPSRIGRPCEGVKKPAVPATPTKDIGSAASSNEALWDTHARRLSEAGLSRHSDSSAVLTEDTDSFIIGQRVWVSGNKPGHIAFIGETQFAPGDWAGIALDEPIGKNDGTVGGIRYFQCEPKKGVFARLTRLTRVPLEGMGSGDTYTASTPSPVGNGTRGGPLSPTGSTYLNRSSMSAYGSNTSLASAASHAIDYRIGDRVIIKSSQGSKVGTVRFIGTTEFAPGEWVGVELDDPRGKNDGSVNGKRYFECKPNFGLFAPVSKVSKSPSKVKPGSCQVHSGSASAGLPPSGLKRTNSKESLLSNTSMTSAASGVRRKSPPKPVTSTPMPTRTALQDLLKEKQQHIEQLLKERDMERIEITRSSSLAEVAEQKLAALQQQFDKYQEVSERRMLELTALLEDEKKKNEDVQFRLEEASISKDDIEVTNQTTMAKLKQLEEQLSRERDKNDALEANVQKLFEAEEALMKAKEETDTLRRQLEEYRTRQVSLEGNTASTAVLISSLQQEVDQYKTDLAEKEAMLEVLNQEIAKQNSETQKQIESVENQKTELEALCKSRDEELVNVRQELETTNATLKEKLETLEKISQEKLNSETNLERQLEKLKMELSSKILDLETISDQAKSKDDIIKKLETELESLRNASTAKASESQKEVESLSKQILERDQKLEEILSQNATYLDEMEKLKASIESLKAQSAMQDQELVAQYTKTITEKDESLKVLKKDLDAKIVEYEEKLGVMSTQISEKDAEIEVANSENLKSIERIKNLEEELETLKVNSNASVEELKTGFQAAFKDKDLELEEVKSDLQNTREKYSKLSETNAAIKSELDTRDSEIVSLKSAVQELSVELQKAVDANVQHASDMKEKEMLIQTLQTELQTTKIDLESASNSLTQYQSNLSDVEAALKKERDDIKEALKIKISEMEDTKKQFTAKMDSKQKELDEVKETLKVSNLEREGVTTELEQLKETHDKISKEKDAEKKLMEETVVLLKGEISKRVEEIKEKSEAFEQKCLEMEKVEAEFESKCKEATTKGNLTKELQESMGKATNEIEKLKSDLENLKDAHITALKEKEKESEEKNATITTLKDEVSKYLEEIKVESLKSTELESKNKEIVEELAKLKQESESQKASESDTVKKLKEDLTVMETTKEELTAKNEELLKLQEQIKLLEENYRQLQDRHVSLEASNKSFEDKESSVMKEMDELKTLHEIRTLELEEAKRQLETISNKHKEAEDRQKKDFVDLEIRISDLLTELENKNNDMNAVLSKKDELEARLVAAMRDMEKLNEELKVTSSKRESITAEFEANVKRLENLCESKQKELSVSQEKAKELEKELDETKEAQRRTEESCRQQETVKKQMEVDMEQISSKCRIEGAEVEKLEAELEAIKRKLEDSEERLRMRENEVEGLKKMGEVVNGTTKDSAPSEVKDKLTNDNNAYKQLMQEKLFVESQVQFLNSIIVDMQKKFEEQKARIEILELGYSSSAAEELASLGFKMGEKRPTPRMYCDICEEFDLHETEDCPTQGEGEPAVNSHADEPKERPPPRPYCELCEVFGHATEECTVDQEF